MAHGLEVRSPFLDVRVAEGCLRASRPPQGRRDPREAAAPQGVPRPVAGFGRRRRPSRGSDHRCRSGSRCPAVAELKRAHLCDPASACSTWSTTGRTQQYVEQNDQRTWNLLDALDLVGTLPGGGDQRMRVDPTLVRSGQWWDHKVPPIIAAAALTLLAAPSLDGVDVLVDLALFLIATVGIAAFGHVVNDLADIRTDALAGAPNQMAPLSRTARARRARCHDPRRARARGSGSRCRRPRSRCSSPRSSCSPSTRFRRSGSRTGRPPVSWPTRCTPTSCRSC